MKKLLAAMGALAVLAPANAFAVTGDVPFNGTVSSTCTINVTQNGTLAANATATVLGSGQAGGVPGVATVTTNDASFDLTVADPTAFGAGTTPADANTNTTFDATVAGTGASTFSIGDGDTGNLSAGVTTATVNLTASKTSGVFTSGTYAATVVSTCE